MVQNFDVAIIGTGPSGAFAAYELAKKGFSTALIDKESLPRYKVCGGGLVFRGKKLLDFDAEPVIEKDFKKIDVFVHRKKMHFTSNREVPVISMVMRDDFDNMLVKKAEENGAKIFQNSEVSKIENGVISFKNNDVQVSAKAIVIADGALSPVAKMLGFEDGRTIIPAVEYEIEVPSEKFAELSQSVRFDIDAIPYGYGWCFPKKNHLSIGVGVLKSKAKLNLKEYCEKYIGFLGIDQIVMQSSHGFVIPISPRKEFVKENCFVIGDSAGFADPIVAEGISNAILSGKIIADALSESGLDVDKAKGLYLDKINADLLPELKIGFHLSKFFYENPKLRNLFIKKFGQKATEALTEVFIGKYLS